MNTVQPQDIAERYISALEDFAEFGQETRLIQAYDLARDALQEGISLAEISGIHHVALQELFDASANPMERLERLEQFFLEVIAVYDMALRGYKSNVQSLQAENLKRRGTEARLRELSDELKRQRDSLDIQVRGRTAELAEKASDLARANLQLQHANREQAEFTYAISHDLKSPVNTIGMLINELSLGYGGLFDEEGRELIDLAVQTVGRMGDLIEDVLSYSRTVERGFSVEPVDLNQLFADLRSDLHGDITSHAVQLEAAELPVVSGNALQLRILFHNLLSNAIKFRDPERPLRIRVSGTADPATGSLRISVSDNGIGIPPEYHKQIFALFQRLHTHDTYPGSGLGLALCKRIALNHKGVIDLSSTPGRGSTFSLVVTGGAYDS